MTGDDTDGDGALIERRWFRIGFLLLVLDGLATLLALALLRVDRTVAAGSVLAG